MEEDRRQMVGIPRRDFIKAAGALALTASFGGCPAIPERVRGAKTLRILQWVHFSPAYEEWFKGTYVKEWGAKHDTEVIVDNIGLALLNSRAVAEVSVQKGHDLVLFLWPPPAFENEVIDHREIYEEAQRKYGKAIPLAIRSTYNPKTKKHFGFSDSYVPDPVNYRKDLWDDVGMSPDTWDDVRVGGRKIKAKHGIPVGIGLAQEIDTAMAIQAIMYSFGASVQDEGGSPALKSKETLDAIKFVKALYEEAMTPEVFIWDATSNNRAMLASKISLAMNAISITRTAEKVIPYMSKKIRLAKAPKGPLGRVGMAHLINVYVIWKFANNIEGAKQFLVDYVGNSKKARVCHS